MAAVLNVGAHGLGARCGGSAEQAQVRQQISRLIEDITALLLHIKAWLGS